LDQTIVAMISSNIARRGHPSRVFVPLNSSQAKSSGLRLDSVIMTDNLATVLDKEIDLVLGRLEEMKPVDEAVKHTLALT
jgi:mRNA interferase MazF